MAIILVVYGHCLRGLTAGGLVPEDSWLRVTDYVVYSFHMPLFFFVSGLFIHNSMRRGAVLFWRSRILTIVYPYFLWSVLQGSVQAVLSRTEATNTAFSFADLAAILWAPISPFWFLYALFFATFAAYVLRRHRPELLCVLAFAAFLTTDETMPFILQDIAYGTFYLSLGVLAQERGFIRWLDRAQPVTAVATAGLFAVAVSMSYWLQLPEHFSLPAAVTGIAASLMLWSVVCRKQSALAQPIAALGQISMAIYVMHILALGLARYALLHVLGVTHLGILLFAGTVTGVAIPVIVHAALVRLRLAEMFGLPGETMRPATQEI